MSAVLNGLWAFIFKQDYQLALAMVLPNKAHSTSECIVSTCSHRFGDQLRHSWLGAFCWTTLIQTEVVLPFFFFVRQYRDQATVAMCHILLIIFGPVD